MGGEYILNFHYIEAFYIWTTVLANLEIVTVGYLLQRRIIEIESFSNYFLNMFLVLVGSFLGTILL